MNDLLFDFKVVFLMLNCDYLILFNFIFSKCYVQIYHLLDLLSISLKNHFYRYNILTLIGNYIIEVEFMKLIMIV